MKACACTAPRLLDQFEIRKNPLDWIVDILTNGSQRLRINGVQSDPVFSSTDSPQGCVLSPLLFILYTNMCQSRYENRAIIKYADVIASLLIEGETTHSLVIDDFVQWREES